MATELQSSRHIQRWILRAAVGLAATAVLQTQLLQTQAAGRRLSAEEFARKILADTDTTGGLIVQIGCTDGKLTAALGAGDGYLVHGLDADPAKVETARKQIRKLGPYGAISVDRFDGSRLPYIDNLVNLIVACDLGDVAMDEVLRVLAPHGAALIERDGRWVKTVKPRPNEIDDWTHYMHDASNNAVAHDSVVGPPRRMQWVGGPRYTRHHDRMSSISAVVSAGDRVFYICDEQKPVSILTPPQWTLIARDAFNGVILWKRSIAHWHTHLWPLKSGPAQLARRLVADDNRVYVTLDLDGPLIALDAATGKTVHTYPRTKATEEVVHSDGLLLAVVNDAEEKPDYDGAGRFAKGYGAKFWDEAPRQLTAVRAARYPARDPDVRETARGRPP